MQNGQITATSSRLDTIEAPLLASLYRYWDLCRNGEALPRLQEFDALELARHAEHLAIIRPETRCGKVLRIQMVGPGLRDLAEGFVAGAALDQVRPEWYRDHLQVELRLAFFAARPVFDRVTVNIAGGAMRYEALILPAVNGKLPDLVLLVGMVPVDGAAERARLH